MENWIIIISSEGGPGKCPRERRRVSAEWPVRCWPLRCRRWAAAAEWCTPTGRRWTQRRAAAAAPTQASAPASARWPSTGTGPLRHCRPRTCASRRPSSAVCSPQTFSLSERWRHSEIFTFLRSQLVIISLK